jgi:arylsulfatase A-like enzyme
MWDKDENGKPLKNKRSLDSWVKQYNQAVKSIDEGVGRIMEVLEETGQIDNTIIIFTSDNGYAWGQHGFRLKIAPYDANLLTPLIVYQPNKFAQGKKCNYPVNGVDIIKTIHAIGNVTPSNSLDGRNLTDLLKNPTSQNWDETPMIQAYTGNVYGNEAMSKELKKASTTGNWEKFVVHQSGIRAWIMMRKGNFKYVRYIYENYIEELYDLTKDPKELNNLAVNNTFHNLLEEYRKETISQFEANGATFTNLLPEPKIISN